MALYTIADLHLSLGAAKPKPMGKFGSRWQEHTEKIRTRWSALVTEHDTVVLPGDFSWAMTLEEAAADFAFLASLPGTKLLSKGNHDFWWESLSKMRRALAQWSISGVDFLQNNAFFTDGYRIVAARGWFMDEKQQAPIYDADYEKIVRREADRLTLSLREAAALPQTDAEILAFLHFPPVWGDFVCEPILAVLRQYGVRRVYYGHIHGQYDLPQTTTHEDFTLTCIAADFLNFIPQRVFPQP